MTTLDHHDIRKLRLIDELVGKPYRWGADGPDAYDCYGMARLIQREIYGHDLPAIARDSGPTGKDALARAVQRHPQRRLWRPAEEPQDGDVALMANVMDRAYHLGVYMTVGPRHFVWHADEVGGAIYDDLQALAGKGFNRITFLRRPE